MSDLEVEIEVVEVTDQSQTVGADSDVGPIADVPNALERADRRGRALQVGAVRYLEVDAQRTKTAAEGTRPDARARRSSARDGDPEREPGLLLRRRDIS